MSTATSPHKRHKTSKTVGTHSGSFHCDEALACYLLTHHTAEFRGAEITRSRDPAVLAKLDIIVDVGAVYDPATHRYDHHQKGFTEILGNGFETKLSSAGLIYKHFGKEIIRNLTSADISDEILTVLYKKVYASFVEAVDATDNGISMYEQKDLVARYSINTGLSARVGFCNPAWNEGKDVNVFERFTQAMNMAGGEFEQAVHRAYKIWLPARQVVEAALQDRQKHHSSGEILVLETTCAWKSHLESLETEMKIDPPIKYAVFEDNAGSWRIQTVPLQGKSFTARRDLPKAWWGLRDDVLSEKTGVPGCIFVHGTGFIGGHKTREGAMKLASMALEMDVTQP